ncbi:MAG: hypothetical protein ABR976_21085 [Terracidiphilus sp.]
MWKLMLGAALAAGTLGLAAAPAKAAEVGVYVRGPVAYVPPSPGVGYVWVGGYRAHGYWFPGRWNYRGPVVRYGGGRFYGRGYYHGYAHYRR